MGRARGVALVVLCGAVTATGWGGAKLAGFEWSGIKNAVAPIWNLGAASLADAAASLGDQALADRMSSKLALASAAARAVDVARADRVARDNDSGVAGASGAEAAKIEGDSAADTGPTPQGETRGRLVSLFRPEAPAEEEEEPQPAARSVEPLDECLVVDICIDEYLWSLYERTPKVDTNKITDRIKTTVKVKGKTRTVTKTTVKYVVADFAWKDPIAAQKAGMSIKDYVIGGMDREFKLKLFRALRVIDDAGFMPGITSAFRDDYRQSIASGNKAASDSSFHGGSRRGGYGHGLAIDLVSVKGATRLQRFASSEELWKWVDAHEKELGVGRPYLNRDPPHIAPIDGREFAMKRGLPAEQKAGLQAKKAQTARQPDARNDPGASTAKQAKSANVQN
jgi:hypothetical protein